MQTEKKMNISFYPLLWSFSMQTQIPKRSLKETVTEHPWIWICSQSILPSLGLWSHIYDFNLLLQASALSGGGWGGEREAGSRSAMHTFARASHSKELCFFRDHWEVVLICMIQSDHWVVSQCPWCLFLQLHEGILSS